jgi:hypothetical protein
MREIKYIEGSKALENFEEGMKVLFTVPKDKVVRAEKKRRGNKASSRVESVRKPRPADKD